MTTRKGDGGVDSPPSPTCQVRSPSTRAGAVGGPTRDAGGDEKTPRSWTNRSQTVAEDAEEALTRRLRRSALSEREARTFLIQRGIDSAVAEATFEIFTSRGWINDAALAEQLLYAGTSRRGQGRRAIAQTLSQRGIPREVADAALVTLPDDDGDRALE